jgi:hypothetical protein
MKCTVCKNCGVTRTSDNWRPSGNLCSKCFYEIHGNTARNKQNANIKILANEIVINYHRKTWAGLLCACKDMYKYYQENKIMARVED